MSKYIAESITMIAGRSWPKRPAIIVIDSATYLLTISSPNLNLGTVYEVRVASVGPLGLSGYWEWEASYNLQQ